MPERIVESTICHVCKDRPEREEALRIEDLWEEHPFECRERRCRTCKRYRKWWWFTVPMPVVAWGLREFVDNA